MGCPIISCGAGTAVFWFNDDTSASLQAQEAELVRQPSRWVPLTYEYMVQDKEGLRSYRVYRASDGSTYQERLDGFDLHQIQIDNMSTRKHYLFHRGQWDEHPLRSQGDGQPRWALSRRAVTPVALDDPRVQAVARLGSNVSLYEFKAPSGAIGIFAPELNMLQIWGRYNRGAEGEIHQITRILLGEPTIAFEPPPGARVNVRSTPGGAGSISEMPSATRAREMRNLQSPR